MQSWFNNNQRPITITTTSIRARNSEEYDHWSQAALCEEVFGDTELVYTKPATRLTESARLRSVEGSIHLARSD